MKKIFLDLLNIVSGFLLNVLAWIGYIFFAIGAAILKKDKKYFFIRDTIEHLFRSIEIYVKVTEVSEHPLFVRFKLEISSSNRNKINLEYFVKELMAQIGCTYTDLDFDYIDSSEDVDRYTLDITKTALSNLEKGTTEHGPEIFEEENTDSLMKKAILLSSKTTVTPELLEKKLNLTKTRAELMYKQLVKAKAFARNPEAKQIN